MMRVSREQARRAKEKAQQAHQGKATGNGAAPPGATPTGKNEPAFIMLDDCKLDTEVFWIIEDILPRCNMMMVYACGGSGKTYLMTSVALGLGVGKWFDHEAEPGAVLVCAFERPDDAEDRLAALRTRYGYSNVPVALLKLGGKRLDDSLADLVIARAKELAERVSLPVRTIQIDTVSAALGGRKEDDEGYGQLRMLGERIHAGTGALVTWIHHEGKGDHMGPRGHLALADGCMVWWHVEEHEDGSRVVHVAKANRGPYHAALFAFKLIPFEAGRDRRGKAIDLCEVQQVDLQAALASPVRRRFGQANGDREPKLGARQKLLLRVLRRLSAKHPDGVDRDTLRSGFILEMSSERENAGKAPLKGATAAAIFRQVLGRLKEHVAEEGNLVHLVA